MTVIDIWSDTLQKSGIAGVVILAGYIALVVGALIWLVLTTVRLGLRGLRRRQLRRELQLLRGGRTVPTFTDYGDPEDRRGPKPPVKSLRRRGDHDAA